MAFEAWKCIVPNCKGFIVFDNADIDVGKEVRSTNGFCSYREPTCTECGTEYLVVPHYTVVINERDGFQQADPVCITEYERRRAELKG